MDKLKKKVVMGLINMTFDESNLMFNMSTKQQLLIIQFFYIKHILA